MCQLANLRTTKIELEFKLLSSQFSLFISPVVCLYSHFMNFDHIFPEECWFLELSISNNQLAPTLPFSDTTRLSSSYVTSSRNSILLLFSEWAGPTTFRPINYRLHFTSILPLLLKYLFYKLLFSVKSYNTHSDTHSTEFEFSVSHQTH